MLIDKMKTEITRFVWEATKDLGVADTSHIVNIPAWGTDYVTGIYGRVKTAFAGITGPVTMKIGTSDDDSCIMPDRDLSRTGDIWSHLPRPLADQHWPCIFGAEFEAKYQDSPPVITFTSLSGNLEDLTAGEVEIIVVHIVPDK